MYVDDIGGSRPSTEEFKHVTSTIDKVLAKDKFQIKVWHSNNPEVDQTSGDGRFTDLLGHCWDKHEDTFCLKKDPVVKVYEDFTKRSCLALLAQVWDPNGLVAPVMLKFRIDLQELRSASYGWDDVPPEETQQKWKWNEEVINQLLTFKFDRKLKPSGAIVPPQVHGFADGGELGYGAGIFLRWKLHDESYQCIPVIFKPFVAPQKRKTIPRLELLGCLALTKICNTCQEELSFVNFKDFDNTFWTDSRTVISCIKTPPRELDHLCQFEWQKSRKQWGQSNSATSNRSVIQQTPSPEELRPGISKAGCRDHRFLNYQKRNGLNSKMMIRVLTRNEKMP